MEDEGSLGGRGSLNTGSFGGGGGSLDSKRSLGGWSLRGCVGVDLVELALALAR